MEQYYRMVIELYQKALQGIITDDEIMSVRTTLAQETTKSAILGGPTPVSELDKLTQDINIMETLMMEADEYRCN